jgi:hypothetical protein
MQRAKATKAYRMSAYWATKATDARAATEAGDILLHVLFNPPSRRSDRQNYPGWIKAGIDGIADALGVNDRRFDPVYSYGEPVKGGRVVVTL